MTQPSSSTLKRLTTELARINSTPLPPFLTHLSPISDSDLTTWTAIILGPSETPYEHGRWDLNITIPESYPMKPPIIKFTTKILHANIAAETGEICLDLLKDKWSPANTILTTLEAVQWLLRYPEPDSPLNVDLAVLYRVGDTKGVENLVRWACEEWRAR